MDEAMHQVIWRLKPVKEDYRQCMPRVYTQNLEMATLPENENEHIQPDAKVFTL